MQELGGKIFGALIELENARVLFAEGLNAINSGKAEVEYVGDLTCNFVDFYQIRAVADSKTNDFHQMAVDEGRALGILLR